MSNWTQIDEAYRYLSIAVVGSSLNQPSPHPKVGFRNNNIMSLLGNIITHNVLREDEEEEEEEDEEEREQEKGQKKKKKGW